MSEQATEPQAMSDGAPRKPWRLPVLLCAAGVLLSLLLVGEHVRTYLFPSRESYCQMGATFDCVAVAASPWSVFLGLPWAVWGLLGFAALWVAAHKRSPWFKPLSLGAAVVSLALLVVSVTQVGAICLLCEAIHLVSWTLAALAFRLPHEGSYAEHAFSIVGVPTSIAVGLILFLPHYWGAFSYQGEPPFSTGVTDEGHPWIGAGRAELTIEEYVDYDCPHCGVATVRSLTRLASEPGWRLVRRQNPRRSCLPSSTGACQAARIALCAGEQGQFWRADRYLFATQQPGKQRDLDQVARDLDLDPTALRQCTEATETYERVAAAVKQARRNKVFSTPIYIVEGKKLTLDQLLDL